MLLFATDDDIVINALIILFIFISNSTLPGVVNAAVPFYSTPAKELVIGSANRGRE